MLNSLRFISILVLLLFCACAEENKGPANIVTLPEGMPDEEGKNTAILLSDSNWTKAVLQVGHARKYGNRLETLIDSGLFVRFFDKDGSLNATLRADSARIDDKTGNMCAYGNVHVNSEKNKTTVDTDKLCYDKESGRFHSDAHVAVDDRMRGRSLRGTGFESDQELKVYQIYNVSGEANSLR